MHSVMLRCLAFILNETRARQTGFDMFIGREEHSGIVYRGFPYHTKQTPVEGYGTRFAACMHFAEMEKGMRD